MWLFQGLDAMVERCKKAATSGVSIAIINNYNVHMPCCYLWFSKC